MVLESGTPTSLASKQMQSATHATRSTASATDAEDSSAVVRSVTMPTPGMALMLQVAAYHMIFCCSPDGPQCIKVARRCNRVKLRG